MDMEPTIGWTLELFFGRDIEHMITVRDVEMMR